MQFFRVRLQHSNIAYFICKAVEVGCYRKKRKTFCNSKMLSICREVFFRRGSVQAGGAVSRHHHDRRSGHQNHWSA